MHPYITLLLFTGSMCKVLITMTFDNNLIVIEPDINAIIGCTSVGTWLIAMYTKYLYYVTTYGPLCCSR